MNVTRKPSRKTLLRVIGELQTLVGEAKGGYMNDRGKDRWEAVVKPLEKAFDLCLQARQFDACEEPE